MAPRRRTPSVESNTRFSSRRASPSLDRQRRRSRSTSPSRQRDRLPALHSNTSREAINHNARSYHSNADKRGGSRDRTRRGSRDRSRSTESRRGANVNTSTSTAAPSSSDRRRDTSISSTKRRRSFSRSRAQSPSSASKHRHQGSHRRSPPPGPRADYGGHHRRHSPGPGYSRRRSPDPRYARRSPPPYDRRGPPPPRSRYHDDYNSGSRGGRGNWDGERTSSLVTSDFRDSTRGAYLDRQRGGHGGGGFDRRGPPPRGPPRSPPHYSRGGRTPPPRRSPPPRGGYPPRYPRDDERGPSYSRRSSRSPPRNGFDSRQRSPERGRPANRTSTTANSSRRPSRDSKRSTSRDSLRNKEDEMSWRGGYGPPSRGGYYSGSPAGYPPSFHGSPPPGPHQFSHSPQQSPYPPRPGPDGQFGFQGSPQYNHSHQQSPHSAHSPTAGTPVGPYPPRQNSFRAPAPPAGPRPAGSPPAAPGAPAAGPHVRNLSWTPKTGTRGGHAPTLHGANAEKSKSITPTEETPKSTNGAENPFRPASKELRVEDEAGKGDKPASTSTAEDEAAKKAAENEAQHLANAKIRIGLPKPGQAPQAPKPNPLLGANANANAHAKRNPFETSLREASRDDERRGMGMRGDRMPSSRFDQRERREPEPRREEPPPPVKRMGPRPALKHSVNKTFYDRKRAVHNVSWARLAPGFGDKDLKMKLQRLRLTVVSQGHPLKNLRWPDLCPKSSLIDPVDDLTLVEAAENRKELEEEAFRRHPKKRPAGQLPRLMEGEVLDEVFKKEVVAVKSKIRRPQKVLPEEYRSSNVYYRKPGNESVVGFGTYGKVFKAKHIYKGKDVALKRLRMEAERDGFPITAMREMKILKHLEQRQGQGVIRLHELLYEVNLQNSVACFMVFEYMPHDLTGLLNHPTFKLSMAQKKDMARQTIDAIGFMHRNGVLHRDIKAANILVSHTGEVKLADFGLARFYDMDRQLHYTNRVVTIWYRAPELLYGQTEYGPAIDVWAVACVIVEIFTRHAAFPGNGKDLNQLIKVWEVMGFPSVEEWAGVGGTEWYYMMRPSKAMPNIFRQKYSAGELGEQTTPRLLDLLEGMLRYDPGMRPTCDECLKHPFFTEEAPEPQRVTTELETLGDWHEFESKKAKRAKEAEDRVEKDLKEGPPSCGQLVRDDRRDRGYRRDVLQMLGRNGSVVVPPMRAGSEGSAGAAAVEKRAANFSPIEGEAKRVKA